MKIDNCPITQKPFLCRHCKAIGKDGKCAYMRFDEWGAETLADMRKLVKGEKNGNNTG